MHEQFPCHFSEIKDIIKANKRRMCGGKAVNMNITLNPDEEIVKTIREGLKAKGGHCPCRLEMTEDTKCMCKEFRDQIADPDFEGYCHCMLYYKHK